MRISRVLFAGLVLQLTFRAACATPVPATVTREPSFPLESPAVFLVATQQRDRVAESLEQAGLSVKDSFRDADYTLNVRVGSSRGSKECGSISNVIYELRGGGQKLLVIKGRGATGTCTPNIFDEMSEKLASY